MTEFIKAISDVVLSIGLIPVVLLLVLIAAIYGVYLLLKFFTSNMSESHSASIAMLENQVRVLQKRIGELDAKFEHCDDERRELRVAYDQQEHRVIEAIKRADTIVAAFEMLSASGGGK